MKKGTAIMTLITSFFIVALIGIFVGRITIDGQMSVHTSKSFRSDTMDAQDEYTGLININTADAELLQELPGIGKSTANEIIKYRKINGPFQSLKEIKKVKGIGDKIYNDIKDLITIDEN